MVNLPVLAFQSCYDLNSSASIANILYCPYEMAAGGVVLASLLVFAIFIYGMFKMRVPFVVALPLGFMLLYFFADVGIDLGAGGDPIFANMMWLLLIVVGGIAMIGFLKLRGRG